LKGEGRLRREDSNQCKKAGSPDPGVWGGREKGNKPPGQRGKRGGGREIREKEHIECLGGFDPEKMEGRGAQPLGKNGSGQLGKRRHWTRRERGWGGTTAKSCKKKKAKNYVGVGGNPKRKTARPLVFLREEKMEQCVDARGCLERKQEKTCWNDPVRTGGGPGGQKKLRGFSTTGIRRGGDQYH